MCGEELEKLLWFMNSVMQCVQKNWPGATRGPMYYSRVTICDEAFGLYLLKFYSEMPKGKNQEKKERLAGKAKQASIEWFTKRKLQLEEIQKMPSDRFSSSGGTHRSVELDLMSAFMKPMGSIENILKAEKQRVVKKQKTAVQECNDYANLFG